MNKIHNILVTGGAGYIGSAFARYIQEHRKRYEVIIFDKLTYAGKRENIEDLGYRFVQGDICDKEYFREICIEYAIDTVVHFAAESHNDNSIANPELFIQTNINGTVSILEVCRELGIYLHLVSTDEVFGDLPFDDSRFTEESPYKPSSPYSSSKASADMLVRAWGRTFGIKYTISNCSNNYGSYGCTGQSVEKFIPRQITNAILGDSIKVYGTGEEVRDWIHIKDHCSGILAILEKGKYGETYLIGADGEKTNNEVAQLIAEAFDVEVEYVNDRPGHDRRYAIDWSKIHRELGWVPRYTNFENMLDDTIRWYKDNEDWWYKDKESIEQKYAQNGQ